MTASEIDYRPLTAGAMRLLVACCALAACLPAVVAAATGRLSPALDVILLVWLAGVAWSLGWYVRRVAYRVTLTGDTLTWSTLAGDGSARAWDLVAFAPASRFAPFERLTGPELDVPVLILAGSGGFVTALAARGVRVALSAPSRRAVQVSSAPSAVAAS